MRLRLSVILVLLACGWLYLGPGPVSAGGWEPTLRYRGGTEGPVVFNHQLHASKGFRCNDCHTNFAETGKILFTTRKQGLITFADHRTAAKCFACHDGKGASEEETKNASYDGRGSFDECERCHYKDAGSSVPPVRRAVNLTEPKTTSQSQGNEQ